MDEHGRLIESGAHPRPPPRASGPPADPLRRMGTRDLVGETARKASELARKEVELAKAEIRADLRREAKMAGGLGAAGLCAIWGVSLLLVAIVLALAAAGMPGWAAALVVAVAVFAVGAIVGLWGWSRRVREPLDATRRSLKENARWARERLA